MENIIIYTQEHCFQCEGLKRLLNSAGISYSVNTDIDYMSSQGFRSLPVLEVNGIRMNNQDAVKWVNERIKIIENR